MKVLQGFTSTPTNDGLQVSNCCGSLVGIQSYEYFNKHCKGLQFWVNPVEAKLTPAPADFVEILYISRLADVKFAYDKVQLGDNVLFVKRITELKNGRLI